jgi:hypothetical protein
MPANVHEILAAVSTMQAEFASKVTELLLEEYQEELREALCADGPHPWRYELGWHACKDEPGRTCRSRKFARAGWRGMQRRLRTDLGAVQFPVALLRCRRCGRRFTLLETLGLGSRQRRSEQFVRCVTEAVAETSYRRGSVWASTRSGAPVARSTAHRWAATVEPFFDPKRPLETLMADGTGYKRQPGTRGEVRMVLGLDENRQIQPLGVWAGTDWKDIARDVRKRLRGQPRPRLLVADGEERLEHWLGRLTERVQRCQWHFVRQSEVTSWKAGMPKVERTALRESLSRLVAIEVPSEEVEWVRPADRTGIQDRIAVARAELSTLASDLDRRGYPRAATYLLRAHKQLFSHLEQWLETGVVGPRTTSIIECMIRELARRLKKIGWNWSDAGATRMGRIVMIRRYDQSAWERYWQERLDLQKRCQIRILRITRAA